MSCLPIRDHHMPPEPCVSLSQRRRALSSHDHFFVASGIVKRYGCYQFGCRSGGQHEARGVCGWPQDEHPPVPVPDP